MAARTLWASLIGRQECGYCGYMFSVMRDQYVKIAVRYIDMQGVFAIISLHPESIHSNGQVIVKKRTGREAWSKTPFAFK